ncbi:nucleoside 2-deoxyribosyltransferase [Neobittarella massiliensis]|uniref:Nucleoside 2-deoxyribosyltransferase n=2 Tax=Oscillospiraceae TaxID=216572 RepID=A0A8J6LU13_9FIRM|nr:nucleoside 2-deoxyribosyltransferase [Neobittarella massiliensis]MBC3516094.1 nucleoside 2-deoxyribosyltransferase [Neobittarella massiliensis]SCJ36981.1 Nucleoside 2-deoxyribosyltransferase [uncultured Anaerotruncus sp.]
MSTPKVCLCTPQRYAPNWEAQLAACRDACREQGFLLLEAPLGGTDNSADFTALMDAVRGCDLLIADMNNFRGWEPDSGACFALGAGYVWGKKIYLYLDDLRSCVEKFTEEKYPDQDREQMDITDPQNQKKGTVSKGWRDRDGIVLENGPLNLMMSAHGIMVQGGFADALRRAKQDLEGVR